MLSEEQLEEVSALAAIYGDAAVSARPRDAAVDVRLPWVDREGAERVVLVTFDLPPGYPAGDGVPSVQLEGLPRGLREPLLEALGGLAEGGRGAMVLFSLVEAVRDHLGDLVDAIRAAEEGARLLREAALAACVARSSVHPNPAQERGITIVTGPPVVVMRSTFVAHVAQVRSKEDCDAVMAELFVDSKIARATHNMRAYRFVDEHTGRLCADNDDDGEDAAGSRMAMLLDAMKADNVIVIVTRWYGGVHLGPLRFKVINDCARQLIEQQPWYAGRDGKR